MQWPRVFLVVVRQEFGAICRDVHVGRALALAGLTRQAQVERFLDALVLPAAVDDIALQHLEQHVRAAPGAVLLFERHHVARAHHAGVLLAALADADAAQRGLRHRPAVIRKLEVRRRICRRVARAQPQIHHRRLCVDDVAGVELVRRIPDRLEVTERGHQLGAEHLRQQRTARPAVAVFARNRSAMPNHYVCCVVDEAAVLRDAVRALEIEADLHVNAAVAEVAVERRLVFVRVE